MLLPLDGVVCLSDVFCKLLLWNPSIHKFRYIPPWPLKFVEFRIFYTAVGFGYNSVEDTYKLVLINYLKHFGLSKFSSPRAYIYSNRGWNKVSAPRGWVKLSVPKKVFSQVIQFSKCCFVNETMHWIVRRLNGEAWEASIVTFDLKTDNFGEIMFPEISSSKPVLLVELIVINNSVAVVEQLIPEDFVIVWKMEAENKAWKPLYTIRKSSAMKRSFKWGLSSPLVVNRIFPRMFRKHREEIIITQTSGRMIVFNKNINSENSGVYDGAYAMICGEAYSFTESLLLLD